MELEMSAAKVDTTMHFCKQQLFFPTSKLTSAKQPFLGNTQILN